ncbi:MAG: outer membrane beta-barrel protein [Bacteroidota bacterium]
MREKRKTHERVVRWLLIGALLLTIQGASAQSRSYIGVRGGAQGSTAFINHTLFPVNVPQPMSLVVTQHYGVVFKHFNFRRVTGRGVHAGLQVGVNYIQRGWKQAFNSQLIDDPTDTLGPVVSQLEPYTARLNYLEFPVEGILYWGKGQTKFFGTLGIYYERLIGSDLDERPDEELLGRDDFFTYEPDRDRENGYGGRLSLGAFSDFSFGTLQLEVFSSISFSGLFGFGTRNAPGPGLTPIPDQSVLMSFGVSMAYLLPFGKMDF